MNKEEVKRWLEILIQDYTYADVEAELSEMRNAIYKALDQEPKTGRWIDDMRLGYHVSICSNCDWRGHGDTCLIYRPKYCPNCGAKMVESQTEGDVKTEDNWMYETGREEPEILGSGSTYYNVVHTKDENEAMKLSKEAARNYLRRTRTENDVTITQEYSWQEGWI